MGLAEKEKELLKQGLSQQWDWSWGLNRMRALDPSYDPEFDFEHFVPEPDVYPETQQEILKYSRQYQEEWRFEREYRLIEHALRLFPEWHYLHERKEWHSRPLFHRDPEKSRVQPRKPLHLPRDPNYIPKQETIDSMCFVTASGSDQPYFDLSIQLLESIKATRWYNHVPIKVLDCGLTSEDAEYIRHRFNAEVKDPGWDVNPNIIRTGSSYNEIYFQNIAPKNGWKGCTARPFIHRHFPGYAYYFWLDTDTWVQTEIAIDRFVHDAERQEIGGVQDHDSIWTGEDNNFGINSIPKEWLTVMLGKGSILNSVYCISYNLNEKYARLCEDAISVVGFYTWGFDMATLSYCFHKELPKGNILPSNPLHHVAMRWSGARTDSEGCLYTMNNTHIGILCFCGGDKFLPHYLIFPNATPEFHMQILEHTKNLRNLFSESFLFEESLFTLKRLTDSVNGSYFYRTFNKKLSLVQKE